MDFDMTSRKKVYFCRRLRHKKELYALVPLHRNLENFKAKNHNKGQDDKARANRREHIVPYCGGFPEPDAGGAMTLAPFFLPQTNKAMDNKALVMRLMELKAQLADIQRRVDELDNLLDGEVTDEAVKQYAAELLKIVEDREPILREARSLLMLVNDATPGGGAVN